MVTMKVLPSGRDKATVVIKDKENDYQKNMMNMKVLPSGRDKGTVAIKREHRNLAALSQW
jgi:hypothetical protein